MKETLHRKAVGRVESLATTTTRGLCSYVIFVLNKYLDTNDITMYRVFLVK